MQQKILELAAMSQAQRNEAFGGELTSLITEHKHRLTLLLEDHIEAENCRFKRGDGKLSKDAKRFFKRYQEKLGSKELALRLRISESEVIQLRHGRIAAKDWEQLTESIETFNSCEE